MPSLSTTLPLRSELAITFTGRRSCEHMGWRTGGERLRAAPLAASCRAAASRLRHSGPSADDQRLALVDARMSTPTAARGCMMRNAIAAAMRDWFAAPRFHRGRDGRPADLARQRGASVGLLRPRRSAPTAARQPLYLHTSPEFACKKLLAAGETRLFSFGPVYRNRERGPLHHPEFTMLEWYRAGETYESLMRDCAALLALAAERAGVGRALPSGPRGRPFRRAGAR